MRSSALLSVLLLVAACARPEAAGPTYARDVAPILHRACASCHRPGQPAPFALLTYDDAARRCDLIAEMTANRVMPPWLMTHGNFAGDRRLSPQEIEVLSRWAAAGAPRGDAAAEPPPPQFPDGWQWRQPDLVVSAPVIRVPADGPNLFRNLVIPLPLTGLRFVEAVEIRPGSAAVHHAVLAVDSTATARRLDAMDAEPGFGGMAVGVAQPPDGHFLGWTPGKQLRRNPPGMAFRLRPGQDLLLQLHLVPTGKEETVAATVGFHFTDEPTTIEPFPLTLWNDRIDLAAGTKDFVLRDQVTVPVAIHLHRVYPHAHYLCRRMRAFVRPPAGEETTLFAIDAWDFNWQDDYEFAAPVAVAKGSVIGFEYWYDNSDGNPSNPHRPPQRVRFGQESSDEMGTLSLMVTLDQPTERPLLAEALLLHDLGRAGQDAGLWRQLAGVQREAGKPAQALAAAKRALQLAPEHADSHAELGLCHEQDRQLAAAEAAYREALRRDPEHGMANLQLGALLARAGQPAVAVRHFEVALRTLPNLPLLHCNLGTARFALEDGAGAERAYRQALLLEPQYAQARFLLGRLLLWQGRRREAREELLAAQQLRPGDAAIRAALAEVER